MLSETTRDVVRIIAAMASQWIDIDHPERLKAEDATLSGNNRFTREALVFAINQQMSLLTDKALTAWASLFAGEDRHTVGVLNPGNIPLVGLNDLLAVVLSGNDYVGTLSTRSNVLLPAFANSLIDAGLSSSVRFQAFDELLTTVDALVGSGSDETMMSVRKRAEEGGLAPERLLLRGHRYSIAVMDGTESEEELVGLAEDMLLHEGLGCRSVVMVWAPVGVSPDSLLDAFSAFRSTFPAHADSSGSLELQRAYLHAVETPHAYSDGMQFLLSRGAPEPQAPLHVRWVEYESLNDASEWIRSRQSDIQLVVKAERIGLDANLEVQTVNPGRAQRPELGWHQSGVNLATFLNSLNH